MLPNLCLTTETGVSVKLCYDGVSVIKRKLRGTVDSSYEEKFCGGGAQQNTNKDVSIDVRLLCSMHLISRELRCNIECHLRR